MVIISCFPRTEAQLREIVALLKAAGLFDQYNEQAHGESVLLSVHTRTFEEREKVKDILEQTGIVELMYSDETAA
ncbi:MAG TPA: hypothetical protein VKY31_08520 [Terriglobia bacterium]|nr:hypothetical protein [Terriglobia bacterium]